MAPPTKGEELNEFRLPLQVFVIATRRVGDDIEYLMLLRSKERSGFWQGVTGAPLLGEELEDAALRELWEEARLEPLSLIPADFSYSFSTEGPWKNLYAPGTESIKEHVFIADINPAHRVTLSNEHVEYRWVNGDEARSLLHWPNNKLALDHCRALVEDFQ